MPRAQGRLPPTDRHQHFTCRNLATARAETPTLSPASLTFRPCPRCRASPFAAPPPCAARRHARPLRLGMPARRPARSFLLHSAAVLRSASVRIA